MIISFYPGSGGHRYKLFLSGQKFDQQNTSMHQLEIRHKLKIDTRYLENSFIPINIDNIHPVTTHTMSTDLINEKLPGHSITRIICDLKKSLQREWEVVVKYNYIHLPIEEQLDGMFQTIKYHHEYYLKFPSDLNADVLVDINTDTTLFGEIMRRELEINNSDFDFVWDVFKRHGTNAPILDIIQDEYKR
jgi:hypothetical protein